MTFRATSRRHSVPKQSQKVKSATTARMIQWRFIVHSLCTISMMITALCWFTARTTTRSIVPLVPIPTIVLEVAAFHPTTIPNRHVSSKTFQSLLSSTSSQRPPATNSYTTSTTHVMVPTKRIVACSVSLHESSINGGNDDTKQNEIVARRIIVKGDVQGGYYRACVSNEVGVSFSLPVMCSNDSNYF